MQGRDCGGVSVGGVSVAAYLHGMTDEALPEAPDFNAPVFNTDVPHATPERPISDVARQALIEAAARRSAEADLAAGVTEHGGPAGPEPTRYGDWELKGLAIDF